MSSNPKAALLKNWAALMVLSLLTACSDGDKEGAAGLPPDSPAPAATNSAPQETLEADFAPLLDQLTQTLRKYSAEKQKVPSSLDELVGAGYLTELPQPPPGKKFVINPQRVEVVLENR